MANGAFNFKNNSGNIVSFISGSDSDIIMSGGTLDLSGMTGLTLGNLTMEGTVETASFAPSYLLTSSFNTYSGTTNTVIGTLQTSTGSLNSFTSSTTSKLSSIETSTSSLNTFTSSATTRLSSIESKTGSYATTGSNQFKNDQVITGSLTVTGYIDTQELRTTYISSSILYRSGSTKFGDELTDTHAFTGSLLVSGTISVPGQNLTTGTGNGASGQVVYFTGNNTIDGTSAFSWNSPTFTIGLSDSSNNIDYKTLIHRHGTLANPGTWTNTNGLQIVDYANDGPSSFQANSLVSIELPRISTSDTYAGNAVGFRVATDDATVLAVKANGTTHLGQNGSVDSGDRLQVAGSTKITGFITAASTGGSGLRIYGSSGTNQWDMYLNGANIRFSDNTGTGGIVFDRPLSGTSATFSSEVLINTDVNILRFGNLLRWGFQRPASDNRYVSFVRNANATATPVWTVDGDNGYIGIGTNTPQEKLTIDGTSSGAYIRINNAGSGDISSGLLIYNGSNLDASIYTNPTFGNTTLLTRENLAIRAGGSQRAVLSSVGDLSVGTNNASVGGAPGNTNGRLNIYTNNGSSAWAQQIRHDSTSGNGLFLRAGNSASYWTAYFAGFDENKVHLAVRGDGRTGVGTNDPLGTLHVTSPGITPGSPSLGWPVYNAEADNNAKRIYFDTGGNNLTATAGYGATVALVLGQYYDSRAVITTAGSGGSSPGDQGMGHGKDLMIKAGQSDNGIGYKGGRLYLSGGMGYTASGYNGNVGDLLLQPFGGRVYINSSVQPLDNALTVNGLQIPLKVVGSLTGYVQGAILLSSGTDSSPSARGQGVFYFNEGNDVTWYNGGLYNATDRWDICRKSGTSAVDESTAQTAHTLFNLTSSGAAYNATGTWGTISSDQRLKENIIDATPKLNDVLSLQVRNFNYIGKEEKYIGFIAQELEEVFPSLVTTNDMREFDVDGNVIGGLEDTKGVKVGMDFAILVKAIQEQQIIIEDLKSRLQTLENN